MPKSNPTREHTDRQHLERVRALTREVEAAILAIEHNDLRQLQLAVANQERICHDLATTKWMPSLIAKGRTAGTDMTSETSDQIQAAYVTLAQLNRVYARVVRRSKRSVQLLSALYSSLGDGDEPPCSGNSQTLSCEV